MYRIRYLALALQMDSLCGLYRLIFIKSNTIWGINIIQTYVYLDLQYSNEI